MQFYAKMASIPRPSAAISSVLGYAAAVASLAILASAPLLIPFVASRIGATGVTIDPVYSGGAVVRTVSTESFHISIHRPVARRGLLARKKPFVQIDFAPVENVPAFVDEPIDIDGDGKPDLRVRFRNSTDPHALLEADFLSLDPRVPERRGVTRGDLSALIVRLPEALVVRVPIDDALVAAVRIGGDRNIDVGARIFGR
ncbi:MAG: hypothetical protein ABTD50_01490 [Polyangiaceae bacterium]|jgi:hypothetical protein